MSPGSISCYLFVIVAFIGAVLIIALPGSDHLENCEPRDPSTPYFQPAGDDYAHPLLNILHGDDYSPDQTTLEASLSFEGRPRKRFISNLLPAWLEFIWHDLYDIRLNISDPFVGGYRANHTLDHHGRRQITDFTTPRLDGSQVYGATPELALSIRRLDGTGKLRTSNSPYNPQDNVYMEYNSLTQTFLNVDARSSGGNPLVAALYQLFVREHNTWCDRLLAVDPDYTEDYLYEMAKHLVVAEMQAVTYQEALPALLNTELLPYCYAGLHHTVRVYTEWAVAALPATVNTLVETNLTLRQTSTGFVVPSDIPFPATDQDLWTHGLGTLFLGAVQQPARLRDLLVYTYDNTINRGRDAALPSYQALYAKAFHGHVITRCEEYISDAAVCTALAGLYDTEEIDLFIGLLAEKNFHSSVLGRLGTWLFLHQLEELKNHDPYYYTSNPAIINFRHKIMHTRLSQIILRQTSIHPSLLHPSVFSK